MIRSHIGSDTTRARVVRKESSGVVRAPGQKALWEEEERTTRKAKMPRKGDLSKVTYSGVHVVAGGPTRVMRTRRGEQILNDAIDIR